MQPKILLIALSVAAFSNCTTAYKSGQTPDDVYYSPARVEEDDQHNNNNRNEVKNETPEDESIRMRIRDYRWRDFDDDYNYNNSPYHYCTCSCNDYGYYYNPRYHPWPIYLTKVPAPNSTPRMVNLNAYTGYNNNVGVVSQKSGSYTGINWTRPSYTPYNSRYGNLTREAIGPSNNSGTSSSNRSRTYSPSSSGKSNSSSSNSSSGNKSSGSVSRPKRD